MAAPSLKGTSSCAVCLPVSRRLSISASSSLQPSPVVAEIGTAVGQIAFDAANGKILWHCPLGNTMQSNTPVTYMLDGHQYVLVGGGDTLFAFYLQ